MRNCAIKTIGLQGNGVGTQHSNTSSKIHWKNQESNKIIAQPYVCEIVNINTTVNMTLGKNPKFACGSESQGVAACELL